MAWLTFENFSCRSEEGRVCLPPVNASFSKPLVIVNGRNGSGKSMLGRVLAGLSPSNLDGLFIEGDLKFQGGATRPHNPRVLGYLPQAWSLALVGSNVRTDLELVERRLEVAQSRMLNEIKNLGLNVEGIEVRHPATLSRGERQRVLLGIISAIDPAAVYLDEPDSFLDEQGREDFCNLLHSFLERGTKIVLATHHPGLYKRFDRDALALGATAGVLDHHIHYGQDIMHDSTASLGDSLWPAYTPCNLKQIPINRVRRIFLHSLPVEGGRLTCILGPNGSGKTTILRSVCADFKRQFGERRASSRSAVMVGDDPDDQLMFRSIADEFELLGLTPRDLEFVGFRAAALQRLGGMEACVLDLSWGMRRLLTILLAVVDSPTLLLIDEPQAGLDSLTLSLVKGLLRELLSEGRAILVTASSRGDLWEHANHKVQIEVDGANSTVTTCREEVNRAFV